MKSLADLPTPCLVLDRSIMLRNIGRMADRATELGVPLRPHGKTPKCVEIARAALERQAKGLTVSTLCEAEAYFAGGVSDLFYAVGLSPDKVDRAAALIRRGAHLTCLVDNLAAARAIADRAQAIGETITLVIELDVDGYRAGIPDGPEFPMLARFINETSGLMLGGVMSYGGASYGCTAEEARALAEIHRQALGSAKTILQNEGLPCAIVSFGSSPATLHAATMDGVTELRCGIYIFQDLFQAAIGACAKEDIAISVLTTVIGVSKHRNRVIVDAGGLALSKDLSTARTAHDAGYGLVCEAETGRIIDDAYVSTTSQELGLVTTFSGRPLPFNRLEIGTKLRILPNHADMTAAAYEEYQVVDGGDDVVACWPRTNRW